MKKFLVVSFKILLPLLILGAGIGSFSYFVSTKAVEKPKAVKERVWNVGVLEAEPSIVASEINVFGSLISARDVELRSLVAGEVIHVAEAFRAGAYLQEGELLIEVDPFSYSSIVAEKEAGVLEARSRLAELQAVAKSDRLMLVRDEEILDLEKRNVARSEKLRKKGNISDKSLDTAKTNLSRQRQQYEQRISQLEIQTARIGQQKATLERQKIALKIAKRDLENTHLLAPFSGYLTDIRVELGKRIDAKDQVARLIDSARMEVKFHLSNQQYGILIESPGGVMGRKVQVSWHAGQASHRFEGEIARIGSEIKSETGGIEVYAVLKSDPKLNLVRSGAFVDVSLIARNYDNAVRVPDHAVFGKKIVYVVEEGRLQPREIEILSNDGTELIVNGDLKSGDQILTSRFAEVGPGIKVEIR
ncbi:hypothetical protein A9Q83_00155 [Alphaproteobacteria bacterium 46_93_T64]|nr:hypothetical protein A9Q83_00155 [Alphaproteobacteria bacterium 46_93_T64]